VGFRRSKQSPTQTQPQSAEAVFTATLPDTAPSETLPVHPYALAPKKRKPWGMIATVVLLVAWFAANLISFPYVIFVKGGAEAVNEKIKIEKIKAYPPAGRILWATVGVKKDPRGLDFVAAWLSDEAEIFRRDEIYPKVSNRELDKRSRAEMEDAKLIATVIATRKLGYETSDGGATIVELTPSMPAAKLLKPGEVIEMVDVRVPPPEPTKPAKTLPKGQKPPKVAWRTRTVDVPTKFIAQEQRSVVGVVLAPAFDKPCKPPFDLAINSGNVGGPSAGLAITLTILDQLSPGELTGKQKIAVTGTIEPDGSVGEIGGVRQKTATVRSAGAKLFIVPFNEVALAKPYAGSMAVVGVRNVDEALAALQKFGGDPLPTVAPALAK
jgi:Lon-like protease